MIEHGRKPTIYDIAAMAGVSTATVSRVLNDYPYIKASVRQKVQDVIRKTGYEPNPEARNLGRVRSSMGTPASAEAVS